MDTEEKRGYQEHIKFTLDKISNDCVALFLTKVPKNRLPTPSELEQAAIMVHDLALALITSEDMLSALPNKPSNSNIKASLKVSWLSIMPKLNVPVPSAVLKIPPERLAFAGGIGSLMGMLLIGGLMHWLLNMRDTGLIVGGFGGAAGLVYGVWLASQSNTVRSSLLVALGVTNIFDVFTTASMIGFGTLWGRLTGFGSLTKRLLIYVTIIILLVFMLEQYSYDRESFEKTVRHFVKQWVTQGALLLFNLSNITKQQKVVQKDVLPSALARAIAELHKTNIEDLPLSVEAVLHEARRLGLDGLTGTPSFTRQHKTTVMPQSVG